MNSIFLPKMLTFVVIILCSGGCAYYNTFYNAQQYYEEAEKIRLQKEGKTIPNIMKKLKRSGCKKKVKPFPLLHWINMAKLSKNVKKS